MEPPWMEESGLHLISCYFISVGNLEKVTEMGAGKFHQPLSLDILSPVIKSSSHKESHHE